MKKFRVALIVALVVIMGVFCLTACSGKVEGKYYFDSMQRGDETYKVGDTVEGMDEKLAKDFQVIELKADNKAVLTSKMGGENSTQEGTWKLSDDKKSVTITVDGNETTLKRDGNKLVLEEGEGDYKMVLTFKK